MAYIFYCKDHPDAATRRQESTPEHLAYIESIMDQVLMAGPLIDDDSDAFSGSCFIYDTDQEQEAIQLLHGDPYYRAGIYARVDSHRLRPAAGSWIGGKIW